MIEPLKFTNLGSYEEFATMEMDRLNKKVEQLESLLIEARDDATKFGRLMEKCIIALREIAVLNNQRDRFSSQIDFIICQILNEKKDD